MERPSGDLSEAIEHIKQLDRRSPLTIGQALLKIRKQVTHGAWLPFLAQCRISDQTALNYMRVARQVAAVPELADALPSHLYAGLRYSKKGFRGETALRHAIAETLTQHGRVWQQVPSATGIIDIVTESAVYEVKFYLSRLVIFEAIGQVLLYRQAFDPSLRAVVVGFHDPHSDISELLPTIQELGVEVLFWANE